MKQNISVEDLSKLSEGQKERLRSKWTPRKYDLVYAQICKNAEYEEYDYFEFVIGNVEVNDTVEHGFKMSYSSYWVVLQDICFMDDSETSDETIEEFQEENISPEVVLDEVSAENTEYSDTAKDAGSFINGDNEMEDDGAQAEYSRSGLYCLQDCLPLLSIGNMIELLRNENHIGTKINDSENQYNLSVNYYNIYENGTGANDVELCDVLWEAVLELL